MSKGGDWELVVIDGGSSAVEDKGASIILGRLIRGEFVNEGGWWAFGALGEDCNGGVVLMICNVDWSNIRVLMYVI